MEKTKKEWAEEITSLGLPVFPLHYTIEDNKCSCNNPECSSVGKHPLFRMDQAPPTFDMDQINEWWSKHPEANIGVYPGDSFVFVDLDLKKGNNGLETICGQLEVEDWEILAETFTVKTPTGGFHLYYKTEESYINGVSILPGVDVRSKGGYVVGPGSVINGEKYEIFHDSDIISVREDIKSILRKTTEQSHTDNKPIIELDLPLSVERAREFLSLHHPAIEGMGGDNHTVVTAALVKDYGVSEHRALGLMLEPGGWNSRCIPSWETKELAVKVHNGYHYLTNERPGSKSGGIMEMYEETLISTNGTPIDEFSDLREITFKGKDITNRGKRREMIIPEWLPAHGLTAVLAERGVGKTVLMLDLALKLACDMEWHGNPILKGWCAVYLCGEDDEGLEEQYRAWINKYEIVPDNERLIIITGVNNLLSAGETEHWTRYIRSVLGGRRALLFVDTWQRATSMASQNDDKDMQVAVYHIESMAKSLGGPVIAAFHPPKKDKSIMGSSVITNATTAIWEMENQAHGKKLEVTRIKGKGIGNYQLFKFTEIYLQELDEHGKERSGVIPEKIGGTEMSMAERQAINDRLKVAFAEVIKELDLERKSKQPNSKHFSVRSVAERIELLTEEVKGTTLNGEDREWSETLIFILQDAGILSFSNSSLNKKIKELFVDDPRGGWELEEGIMVETFTSGKHRHFRIRKSEI